MSRGGTQRYGDEPSDGVPELVRTAVARAEELDFELCVRPEIGRLLALLAAGMPAGALVGETGTGTGAGLAWMVSAANPGVRFISYELDAARSQAAQKTFENSTNVEVVRGDAAELFERGPFDLLVLDGGPGSGKSRDGSAPVEPSAVLRAGGTMTIDDYTPTDTWPPMFDGSIDNSRVHWLDHSDMRATEIRVAADLAVVVGRYLPTHN